MTIIPLFLLCIFFIVLSKKTKLIYEKSNLIDYYLSINRNYLIYVSETKKIYWKKINNKSGSFYITDNDKIHKDKIMAFCVLYPSGEILHISKNVKIIPEEAYWIEENEGLGFEKIPVNEIDLNSSNIKISNKKSSNPSKNYYTTEIINNMDCNIFPVAFGGYIKKENEFILDNVVDSAYSAKQFKNWYGCSKEYLSPGEKVSDPNNYGNGYWLYIFKTEFGDLLKIGKES